MHSFATRKKNFCLRRMVLYTQSLGGATDS